MSFWQLLLIIKINYSPSFVLGFQTETGFPVREKSLVQQRELDKLCDVGEIVGRSKPQFSQPLNGNNTIFPMGFLR